MGGGGGGGLTLTQELLEGGMDLMGPVVVSFYSLRKTSWICCNWCFYYSYKKNCIRNTLEDQGKS